MLIFLLLKIFVSMVDHPLDILLLLVLLLAALDLNEKDDDDH